MPNEWQTVLDEIKNNVSDMAYATFFTQLKFISNQAGILTLSVPNIFIKTQIEGKYNSAVVAALKKAGINYGEIKIIQSDSDNKTISRRAVEILPDQPARTVSTTHITSKKKEPTTTNVVSYGGNKRFSTSETGLNPKYRFDNYVIGSNNDLAVSAAQAVIDNPGTRYNPYFLYGGPGLGKTHLIQAIGNALAERYPEKQILYVTIEQFYHDFVEAMRKRIDGFTEKYRNVDVLIVDDFQFIAGKEKSQEEFFHTFNELQQHDKQIIICSDRLPAQIAAIDDRLASRLMMGVPIDIQMPDFEVRCAIVKMKAEMLGSDIDDKTVEYIAENCRTNIRDLEGQLNQILALADLRGIPPSELIDDNYIAENSLSSRHRNITPKQVIDKVAKYYDLTAKDLLGTSRVKNIKNARQIAMYLMNEELGLSTVRIGNEFKKDHTTIMHGIKVIKTSLKNDFNLREQISELRDRIYSN